MKKKAIEKIPYQTAEKAPKEYVYVATTFTWEICDISHLFVEIYKNKITSLSVPWLRAVFTKKDWGLYFPSEDRWSAADFTEISTWSDGNESNLGVHRRRGIY